MTGAFDFVDGFAVRYCARMIDVSCLEELGCMVLAALWDTNCIVSINSQGRNQEGVMCTLR